MTIPDPLPQETQEAYIIRCSEDIGSVDWKKYVGTCRKRWEEYNKSLIEAAREAKSNIIFKGMINK